MGWTNWNELHKADEYPGVTPVIPGIKEREAIRANNRLTEARQKELFDKEFLFTCSRCGEQVSKTEYYGKAVDYCRFCDK